MPVTSSTTLSWANVRTTPSPPSSMVWPSNTPWEGSPRFEPESARLRSRLALYWLCDHAATAVISFHHRHHFTTHTLALRFMFTCTSPQDHSSFTPCSLALRHKTIHASIPIRWLFDTDSMPLRCRFVCCDKLNEMVSTSNQQATMTLLLP